jgi:phosphate transport system permease protein
VSTGTFSPARLFTLDPGLRLIGVTGGLSILCVLVAFLFAPSLLVYPLLGFLVVVGYGLYNHQEATMQFLMFLTTISTVLVLGLITVYLVVKSLPAFRIMGFDILLRTEQPFWDPAKKLYSLVPMMWGTFLTTLIAMAIAAPLGVAGALFISEIAPRWAREILKPAVEVLAGIPSIVYGYLGFVVLVNIMNEELSTPVYGSLLAVGLVIGVMALPTVVSVAEDAIDSVPDPMKDGSMALGATDWQTVQSVTLPASFSGVSAAILLGVGRAVGETMAAAVILAHVTELPDPLWDVFSNTDTLTGLIISQYGIAGGSQMSALFAAGVVLFVTVLLLSLASQAIESHMRKKLGGGQ